MCKFYNNVKRHSFDCADYEYEDMTSVVFKKEDAKDSLFLNVRKHWYEEGFPIFSGELYWYHPEEGRYDIGCVLGCDSIEEVMHAMAVCCLNDMEGLGFWMKSKEALEWLTTA